MPDLSPSQIFAMQFSLGFIGGLLLLLWQAGKQSPVRLGVWIDISIGASVLGTIMARVLHTLRNCDYFSHFPEDIPKLWYGGLSWHGAVIGALLGTIIMCRLRRVSLAAFGDGLALALPCLLMSGWAACRQGACGYGRRTGTYRTTPDFFTGYLPDRLGDVVLRFELQIMGVWLGLALLLLITWLTVRNKLAGVRLWVALFFMSALMFGLGFYRADPADRFLTLRIEQWIEVVFMIGSVIIGVRAYHHRGYNNRTPDDNSVPLSPEMRRTA